MKITNREFSIPSQAQISSNFIIIQTDASWDIDRRRIGLGFVIYNNQRTVLLVGPMGGPFDNSIQAEFDAIIFALNQFLINNWKPNLIQCDCSGSPLLSKIQPTLPPRDTHQRCKH